MRRYYIWTIGCQMNKADSQQVANYLERAGLSEARSAGEADLIVLNSCVVREHAETKVVNKLNSLRGLKKSRPEVTIALTGCMVGSQPDHLKGRFPWVDLFFRPQQWEVLSKWGEAWGLPGMDAEEDLIPHTPCVTAYVPVIHGCDSFCSYCIVPYRRGRARSRNPDEILRHVQELVQHGTKEVILLGQIVDAYGQDLPSEVDLADLLAALNRIEGLLRIRFLTSHPSYMSRRLISAVADLDKVCEHISLPIQAGDNGILAAMKRGYTREQYGELVKEIRCTIPGVALSTDVIVGFPGETNEQFTRTLEVLERTRFDKVHIAAYSPRPETTAARNLKDDLRPEEKEARRAQAESLQNRIAAQINAALLGQTVEVLVEGQQKGKWCGRTRGDKLVFFTGNAGVIGRLVNVRIEKTSAHALQGVAD
ncbi:MAG: tRNA (N6-isopentenyl adenosine(37)-C2)-methylthiotransferase MiaB [Dehalococcoidia bacterium]|nr:tRNA (N6-isopentenyl adenosine(37)-C2)-methylthiotransferase MiaB [Dehalococcoidia bacterium]